MFKEFKSSLTANIADKKVNARVNKRNQQHSVASYWALPALLSRAFIHHRISYEEVSENEANSLQTWESRAGPWVAK